MKSKYNSLLILIISLISCGVKIVDQRMGTDKEVFDSASQFAKLVLGKQLRKHFTEYKRGEVGVDALFESDGMMGYTTFSNELYQKGPSPLDVKGCVLFAANFKNEENAKKAFNQLKSNSAIRASEVIGMVGVLPVQVRFLEQNISSGALITQHDNYVFYLPATCESSLHGSNSKDYENLFLSFIIEQNQEIEIINVDCEMDTFLIKKIKVSK